MANFKQINKAIKKEFPNLDIKAVRGDGYIYFDGADGLDIVDSIMAHPPSLYTEDAIRLCIFEIHHTHG